MLRFVKRTHKYTYILGSRELVFRFRTRQVIQWPNNSYFLQTDVGSGQILTKTKGGKLDKVVLWLKGMLHSVVHNRSQPEKVRCTSLDS